MVKSKTKIEKQILRKSDSALVETIISAKKNKAWIKVAEILSGPRKLRKNLNLNEINKLSEKSILVPGKILSDGKVEKKMKIVALAFSGKAKEKLLKAGCEISTIDKEIKSNPSAEGIKILQ